MSHTYVGKVRDAFAELALKFNRQCLRDAVAAASDGALCEQAAPLIVSHVHDEASVRVRSSLCLGDDADVDMSGCGSVGINRSSSSKVQNHHVTITLPGACDWRSEWFTELQVSVRFVDRPHNASLSFAPTHPKENQGAFGV